MRWGASSEGGRRVPPIRVGVSFDRDRDREMGREGKESAVTCSSTPTPPISHASQVRPRTSPMQPSTGTPDEQRRRPKGPRFSKNQTMQVGGSALAGTGRLLHAWRNLGTCICIAWQWACRACMMLGIGTSAWRRYVRRLERMLPRYMRGY